MRRLLTRGLVLATVAAGVVLGPALPAISAEPPPRPVGAVLTTTGNAVLYGECQDYPMDYSVNVDASVSEWTMSLSLFGPAGTSVGPRRSFTSREDPSSGTTSFQLCGGAGTYTVRGGGDTGYGRHTYWLIYPGVTFEVRLPQTTTALEKKVRRGSTRLTVRVEDERPEGYVASDAATVKLERLDAQGRWTRLPGSKGSTDSRGRFTVRVARTGERQEVRAVTTGTDRLTGSESRTVTIR